MKTFSFKGRLVGAWVKKVSLSGIILRVSSNNPSRNCLWKEIFPSNPLSSSDLHFFSFFFIIKLSSLAAQYKRQLSVSTSSFERACSMEHRNYWRWNNFIKKFDPLSFYLRFIEIDLSCIWSIEACVQSLNFTISNFKIWIKSLIITKINSMWRQAQVIWPASSMSKKTAKFKFEG